MGLNWGGGGVRTKGQLVDNNKKLALRSEQGFFFDLGCSPLHLQSIGANSSNDSPIQASEFLQNRNFRETFHKYAQKSMLLGKTALKKASQNRGGAFPVHLLWNQTKKHEIDPVDILFGKTSVMLI